MPIKAQFIDGQLLSPREMSSLDQAIEETNRTQALERKCWQILDEFGYDNHGKVIVEKWGIEPENLAILYFGFVDQSDEIVPVAINVLKKSRSWVDVRIERLTRGEFWVGDSQLGERFGVFAEPEQHECGAFGQILELMEISGDLESIIKDGERHYKAIDPTAAI